MYPTSSHLTSPSPYLPPILPRLHAIFQQLPQQLCCSAPARVFSEAAQRGTMADLVTVDALAGRGGQQPQGLGGADSGTHGTIRSSVERHTTAPRQCLTTCANQHGTLVSKVRLFGLFRVSDGIC